MAKFMVLYRSSVSAGEQMGASTPEQQQEGMEQWMKWAGNAGDRLVDLGSPLQYAGSVGGGSGDSTIGGFSVIDVESSAAAEELLADHPHLQSPGNPSIEILEYLAIPGM